MGEMGLRGVQRGKKRYTTVSDTTAPRAPDLVCRHFKAERPNELWLADLTYVSTWEGWSYVAFILDVFSRMIVGWQIADHLRTDLVLDALEMAIWRRDLTDAELRHHSDAGCQGELNRSSQHLDRGGVRWGRCGSGSGWCSCIGGRFRRPVGRRWLGGRTGSGSGQLSLEVSRPRTRRSKLVCHHRSRSGGSATLAV